MCGILGQFSTKETGIPGKFRVALDRLAHRGPDGERISHYRVGSGALTLGHRRLAIIDLSDDGLQPMEAADGQYSIVFNGELYNYIELRDVLSREGKVFKTKTDTEVILAAWDQWGPDCLHRLDGMFAFAVLDRRRQILTCVRDPFGIKPFIYSGNSGGFVFGSEVPAVLELLSNRPKLNLSRAHNFLLWGDYDDTDDTFHHDVLQLRPGHMLTLDLSEQAPQPQKPSLTPALMLTSVKAPPLFS